MSQKNQKFQDGYKQSKIILIVVIAICILQIAILWLPEFKYRLLEYITTDAALCLLSLAALTKTPYRYVKEKAGWAAVFIYHLWAWAYNALVQKFAVDATTSFVAVSATLTFFVLIYALRYSFRWRVHKEQIAPGSFYEIIGKPLNGEQFALAVKTGLGGSFSITDGKLLWLYSNISNQYEEVALPPWYCNERMIKLICKTSDHLYSEVRAPIGTPYDLTHNCDNIHSMAIRWRKNKWTD